MIWTLRLGLAASLAAAMAFAGEVQAQQPANDYDPAKLSMPQQNEMYCVYDALARSEDRYDIADAYLDLEATDDMLDEADALIEPHAAECARKYGWDDHRRTVNVTIGLFGTNIDVLRQDFYADGFDEEDFDAVLAVADASSEEDLDALFDGSWAADDGFKARKRAALLAAGAPDDAGFVEQALLLMESAVVSVDAVMTWIDLVRE